MANINIPLLRKAVEWVESQAVLPERVRQWEQSTWMAKAADRPCGTVCCVAGYVVYLTHPAIYDTYVETPSYVYLGDQISFLAAKELGLNSGQAEWLFYADHTATAVRDIAEEYAGEAL